LQTGGPDAYRTARTAGLSIAPTVAAPPTSNTPPRYHRRWPAHPRRARMITPRPRPGAWSPGVLHDGPCPVLALRRALPRVPGGGLGGRSHRGHKVCDGGMTGPAVQPGCWRFAARREGACA
jgi:hypothetical protein